MNPIKTASKSVGNVVKSVPDGVVKIGDGIGKAFSSQKTVSLIFGLIFTTILE